MGNPGDPSLQPFAERTLATKSPQVAKCKNDLEYLNDLRKACHAVCKAAMLFRSFQQDMFDNPSSPADPSALNKIRNNAAYEATEVLLASIVRVRLLQQKFLLANEEDDLLAEEGRRLNKVASFMLLDDVDDHRCPKLQRECAPEVVAATLVQLFGEMQHYIEIDPSKYGDPHEVLFMFLKGISPLPRCKFAEGTSCHCENLADTPEVPLCDQHRCRLLIATGRCENAISAEGDHLCAGHACCVPGCDTPRFLLNGVALFCPDHVCFKCVELGVAPAMQAYDEPPRNVCWEHQLCCSPDCRELAMKGEDYCEAHSTIRCTYTPHQYSTRWSLGQCTKNAISRAIPFCAEHAEAALNTQGESAAFDDEEHPVVGVAVRSNAEKRVCIGTNRKGKRCGSNAMSGSEFCHAHAPSMTYKEQQQQQQQQQFVEDAAEQAPTEVSTALHVCLHQSASVER